MTRVEKITEHLVKKGYTPFDVKPVLCIQSGSRGYGISVSSSDTDMIAVHLMSTQQCLEHPDWRSTPQMIRKQFTDFSSHREEPALSELPPGMKDSSVSLDSFEMWKFITLWTKGSPVVYELLWMPPEFIVEEYQPLFSIMRQGISNRIGRTTRGFVLNAWAKKKDNRKKAVIAYHRTLQSLHFLRTNQLIWDTNILWENAKGIISEHNTVLEKYLEKETRNDNLSQKEQDIASSELANLIGEVEKAMITTKLPDQVPKSFLDEVLTRVRRKRSEMILHKESI